MKILKNNTVSDITLETIGIIPAQGQLSIDARNYLLLASDLTISLLETPILDGDVTVNDGKEDLPPESGLSYIRYPDNAFNLRFDNSNSILTSNNVRDALRESTGKQDHYFLTNSTSQSTSSNTRSQLTGMNVTPVAGTYLVTLEVEYFTDGFDATAAFSLALGGSLLSGTERVVGSDVSGLSTVTIDFQRTITITAKVTVNGSQSISGRYRETGNDSVTAVNKSLTLIKVG